MPEVTVATQMSLSPEAIWDFVKDMNNWAPFVTGYQRHEILSDTDSIWTLKGDVGLLARTVQLRAHVVEWRGPHRIAFTLTGLNEVVEGGGVLEMQRWSAETAAALVPRRSWWRRFWESVFRMLYRRLHGPAPKRLAPPANPGSRLTFTLRMDAGGP